MLLIVAAHNIPYVATASLSNLHDLIKKVRKALSIDGPSYIQILCPCIPGWKMESNKTIEYSDLAVKTKINPLYEVEDGLIKVQDTPNPLPVVQFLKEQGRFKHLTSKEIKEIQKHIDEKYKKLKDLENSKIKL